MKDKNAIVVAVGLIVMLTIVVFVNNANSYYTAQSIKQINAVNSLILQQKEMLIKRLFKELNATKEELSALKEKITNIATDIAK